MSDNMKHDENETGLVEIGDADLDRASGALVPIMLAALYMTSAIFGYNIGRDLAQK